MPWKIIEVNSANTEFGDIFPDFILKEVPEGTKGKVFASRDEAEKRRAERQKASDEAWDEM